MGKWEKKKTKKPACTVNHKCIGLLQTPKEKEFRPPVIIQLKIPMQVNFIWEQRRKDNNFKQLGCFI